MRTNRFCTLLAAMVSLAGLATATTANAAQFSFTGSSSDGTTSGTADFTLISPSQLQLVVTCTSPGNGQGVAISGFNFNFAGMTLGTLTSVTGTAIDFNASTTTPNSQFLLGAVDTLGKWQGTTSAGEEDLTTLGGGQPFSMIIGLGDSPNGNPKNFEPYILGTATFLFNVSNVNNPTVGPVTFFFGTGPDSSGSTGTPTPPGGGSGSGIPEPASLSLLGIGTLAITRRRRRA